MIIPLPLTTVFTMSMYLGGLWQARIGEEVWAGLAGSRRVESRHLTNRQTDTVQSVQYKKMLAAIESGNAAEDGPDRQNRRQARPVSHFSCCFFAHVHFLAFASFSPATSVFSSSAPDHRRHFILRLISLPLTPPGRLPKVAVLLPLSLSMLLSRVLASLRRRCAMSRG